ncbi:hypothetical protein [Microbacterium sp. NPDC076911]|uniref:hypothetical protein n=1 Tax=Microbacterium sp. NPDC076911 TaxID=3154958 RepID=UPI00341E70CE
MFRTRITKAVLAAAACTTVASMFVALPASAADAGVVAEGDDWTITEVAGGYEVVKTLDEPLEITADVPTLWADDLDLGFATESLDGMTLSATTADPEVVDTDDVLQGWAGQGNPSESIEVEVDSFAMKSLLAPLAAEVPELTADPSAMGDYAVERLDYDLGDEAIELSGFDRLGEMRAAVFMPEGATGALPVVVFLHGRHTSCTNGTRNPLAWPCGEDQDEVPSYLGYNDAAEILASQGYAVVSVSANAVNALDGSLSDDTGALARAQLVIDHLDLLRDANAGTYVSPDDAIVPVSASLAGRLDLDNVGLMGHSRGGEGIMRAAVLNAEQDEPFGINSVLPIAPTSYSRIAVPGVITATLLPYCDGDVEDQMGQKYINDSRHSYDDDVLRSSVLIMGTNHNYFNTIWTPDLYPYATSDDWRSYDREQTDATCGSTVSETRLDAAEQYAVGNAYMAAFFRLTLGGADEFLPMFDGTDAKPADLDFADIRVSATQPASTRFDIDNFDVPGTTYDLRGSGTYVTCEGISSTPVPGVLPYCINELGFAQAPDWGNAGSVSRTSSNPKTPGVPSTTAMHFTYTSSSSPAELGVTVPGGSVDATAFENLSLRISPDETVATSTEITIQLIDGSGATASVVASEYGDALTVLPGSGNPLRKVLLQQITIPVGDFTGIDLTDVRQVRFIAPDEDGGVMLSDLALLEPASIGTAEVSTRPVVSVGDVIVDEGSGPSTLQVPIYLSRPAEETSTMYFSAVSFASAKIAGVVQKVTFAPGETCTAVEVPYTGDTEESSSATTNYTANVATTAGGVTIGDSFAWITLREDDGVTDGTPVPEVGVQGDPCLEATGAPGTLTVSPASAAPGDTVTVTGSGFRTGESVSLTMYSDPVDLGSVVSNDGSVSFTAVVPADAELGEHEFVAAGYGSGSESTSAFTVAVEDTVDPGNGGTDGGTGTDSGTDSGSSTDSGSTDSDTDGATASDGSSVTSLPVTGLDTGIVMGWAALASILIAVGVGALMIRRQRASHNVG